MLDEGGDGLIAIDNYLVATTFSGNLVWYDMDEYPSGSFIVGISGLTASGDIGYDRSSSVICIPEVAFSGGGVVQFVEFIFPVTTTTTTVAPGSGVGSLFSFMWKVLAVALVFIL
mmetsp:Transcript_16368/g.25200  ORF Transcript_16368/g.25200 Transcript_16368/m.25200 type:complete len:115 (-) Transcript_16368:191-535(-)